MNLYKTKIYIAAFLVILSCTKPPATTSPRQITLPEETPKASAVLKIADNEFTKEDLKISLLATAALDSNSTGNLIDELLMRKLFVAEAISRGYDKTESFDEELQTNIKLGLEKLFVDETAIKKLGDQAYERYLKELNASHIFIPIHEFAPEEDTLRIYNELLKIRETALANDNFEQLAKSYSQDSKTSHAGGSLGWFSVFNLIYPLENAAYSLEKGEISMPVRTQFGYHLIKLNDIRNNSGKIKVQHIWKEINAQTTPAQKDSLSKVLENIRTQIIGGAEFEEMAEKYSDDYNSRNQGGVLPVFGVGTRIESTFENVAYSLKKGEISKVFRSTSGLHIIKLMEKYEPENKATFIKYNEGKLITDSRAEFLFQKRIEDFKKNNTVKIHPAILESTMGFSNNSLIKRSWKKPNSILNNEVLFNINEQGYHVGDFFDYVVDKQEFENWPSSSPQDAFRKLLTGFIQNSIVEYQEREAVNSSNELKNWIALEKENLIFSNFYNKNIIEKSLTDSTGQKLYYQLNKKSFETKEVGRIKIVSFKDQETYDKFKAMTAEPKPYRLFRGITPIQYEQNRHELDAAAKQKLYGLIEILKENPGFIVEVGGHSDKMEDDKVSELRIKEIVDFLVKNEVPLTRILEVNFKNMVNHDRFDWSKNQIATFQFFSNLETDLIKTFNTKDENTIVYSNTLISRKDFESKMKTGWATKTGLVKVSGRLEEYTLIVNKDRENYRDYIAEVINGYQDYLKTDLFKKLSVKFGLNFDKGKLESLINDLKKEN